MKMKIYKLIVTLIILALAMVPSCTKLSPSKTREQVVITQAYTNLTPAEIRNRPEVIKAMGEYRKAHPVCEWDNCNDSIQVHHIIPISVRPDLAANTNNMISLGCKRCHLCLGHAGNTAYYYVANIKEICTIRVIETNFVSYNKRIK